MIFSRIMRLTWLPRIAVAALAALAALAAVWGAADVFRVRAELILDQQGDVIRTPLTKDRIARALEAYALAQRVDGRRPDLLAGLGDMHAMLVADAPPWDAEAKEHRRAALDYYRAAIVRRPSWPHTWANLAVIKFRLVELDREFLTALERAAALGPWEPEVQKTVADLGLAAWDVLPEETRAQVRADIERGMRRQGETMVRLALRHRRADVVAPLVQNDNRLAAVLKAGVATPRPAPRASGVGR